jgi:uncharacterized protein with NRDE domain
MCVLALWLGGDPRRPLIAAANRDENLGRPAVAPGEIEPGIVAPRDLQGGGTWLGVTRQGLFVAVTNRRQPPRSPEARSRGLLALEALRCDDLAQVEALVARRTREQPVAGFNLIAVLGNEGICCHWNGAFTAARFGPGLHVLSNDRDLDDPAMPEKKTLDAFLAAQPGIPDEAALAGLLRSHDGERPICKHGDTYGTVSSTLYVAGPAARHLRYADGPPCRTEFRDYSSLLR